MDTNPYNKTGDSAGEVAGTRGRSAGRTGPISVTTHKFWISLDRIKHKNIMKAKHK